MTTVVGEVDELGLKSEDVCGFYEKHWKRRIALTVLSFYRWQFTQSPSDAGRDHCMVAVNDTTREILGVMGLNRRPFVVAGQKENGAELTTWVVSEAHAGKGVGAKILRETQRRYNVLVGMGITEMALPIYMRSGFRYIKAIPRYIRVFNFDAVEKYARYNSWAQKLVKQWAAIGGAPFHVDEVSYGSTRNLEPIFEARFNHFSREFKYLEWRYSRHPVFEYKQFIIRSLGNAPGKGVYVCLREELSVEGLRLIHVMDCVGDDLDMASAIGFIHHYCVENNIHLADFYCTSTRISRYFVSSGWFSTNDDSCFQFPHLFHPIEFRNPPTTSLIYWGHAKLELSDTANLYITKQDADLDRPTVTSYVES